MAGRPNRKEKDRKRDFSFLSHGEVKTFLNKKLWGLDCSNTEDRKDSLI